MGKNNHFTIKERINVDLDTYLSETISIISQIKQDIDLFMLNSDLKQYILDESESLSKNENISINEAVDRVMNILGSPQVFAQKVLSEVKHEKKYLLGKIFIASLLALFPVIAFILAIVLQK